jgi:predicted DNA-binding protein YlxM (UPF0122 family)
MSMPEQWDTYKQILTYRQYKTNVNFFFLDYSVAIPLYFSISIYGLLDL